MDTPTTRSEQKMNSRGPVLMATCPLTITETRYPRKFAVLIYPIWEYVR
jgi:hypothetical protein